MSCGIVKQETIDLIVREFNLRQAQAEELLNEALDAQLGLESSSLSSRYLADVREDALHYMRLLESSPDEDFRKEFLSDLWEYAPHSLREDIVIKRGFLGWFLESIPKNAANTLDTKIMELQVLAQDKIIQGFKKALFSGGEYPFGVPCAMCSEGIIEKNAAKIGAKIEKSRSIVDGTISDIVLIPPNGNPVIIDIVYELGLNAKTHTAYIRDFEASLFHGYGLGIETYSLYEESDLPVLIRQVSWGDVAELDRRFTATYSLNLPPFKCQGCRKKEGQAEHRNGDL